MWDALSSVLGGGLLGGMFRMVPEVLKFFDAKNDRAHELRMQQMEYQFQKLRGEQAVQAIEARGQVEWNTGALGALESAIQTQGKAASGVRWVDAISALIRPLITIQWVLLLYPAVLVASFLLAVQGGREPLEALVVVFGPEEKALAGGILNFWFLGRVFDKVRLQR
jgi:hypothetical protein